MHALAIPFHGHANRENVLTCNTDTAGPECFFRPELHFQNCKNRHIQYLKQVESPLLGRTRVHDLSIERMWAEVASQKVRKRKRKGE